jgi:hypothetical protein
LVRGCADVQVDHGRNSGSEREQGRDGAHAKIPGAHRGERCSPALVAHQPRRQQE